MAHWSDCATNNGPALPVGPCDCGNTAPETPQEMWNQRLEMDRRIAEAAAWVARTRVGK